MEKRGCHVQQEYLLTSDSPHSTHSFVLALCTWVKRSTPHPQRGQNSVSPVNIKHSGNFSNSLSAQKGFRTLTN